MNADPISYQRAASVGLIGLFTHIVFTLGLLLFGIYQKDPAAQAGAYAMIPGIIVWFGLVLVFFQHKLERVEALEAEAYATSDAARSRVFEEAGADVRVQSSRLAWMHRWFLPILSLVVGGAYVIVGAVRLPANLKAVSDAAHTPEQSGWLIAVGLGIAIVSFIFARFIAGMAKEKVWDLLHGGAGAAVSAALIGMMLALAHFLASKTIGNAGLLKYLPVIFSVYAIALGAEAFLNFVLNLYRPRKKGEYLRPAFDSRVLAFAAAPDRLADSISDAINYQFGYNVSSTWFYRLVARSITSLAILGLGVLWLLSAFAVVQPNERGMLLKRGKLVGEKGPGLVMKEPWPLGSIKTYPASQVNEFTIGGGTNLQDTGTGPILWTDAAASDQQYIFVRSSSDEPDLVAADVTVQYEIADLSKYLRIAQDGPSTDREQFRREILRTLAQSTMMRVMSAFTADDLFGPSRPVVNQSLSDALQSEFDARLDAGVHVVFVGMAGVRPEAQTVAPSFENVVQSDQIRQTDIEKATANANRTLASVAGDIDRARDIVAEIERLERMRERGAQPSEESEQESRIATLILDAGGEAAQILSEAGAYRWDRHMNQRAEAARTEGRLAAYRAAPEAYRMAIYLEALKTVIKDARVFITPVVPRVEIDKKEDVPDLTGFAPMDQVEPNQ
ncbi:MAG: hypothetical protein H6812_05325 [Phycisphaeraceae bacterium]|nr:hypothetical protein [Phycisphaerales bacterium]MCB9842662.1 hypothetical protein [Phycisphaeraceae bacterium]